MSYGPVSRVLLMVGVIVSVVCAEGVIRWHGQDAVAAPLQRENVCSPQRLCLASNVRVLGAGRSSIRESEYGALAQKGLLREHGRRFFPTWPSWLDVGLEQRTRFEVYDHPWRSSQPLGRTDPQIQLRSRFSAGVHMDHARLAFEGQDARVFLDDADDFVNVGSRNKFDILQAFVSISLDSLLGAAVRADVQIGRFTMDVGSRRLVARNRFRNTTNAFDGVHVRVAQRDGKTVRAFMTTPVIRRETRLDTSRQRYLSWGLHGETNRTAWGRVAGYYVGLRDRRDSQHRPSRNLSTFGARWDDGPARGAWDYDMESVWQVGAYGEVSHFAHFQHVGVGYTVDAAWSPRLALLYDYASGDRSAADRQHSAFDSLFGARRFEYMPTGNFGPFFRSNISSPGWRVSLSPAEGWHVFVKQRWWYLATSRGAFGNSGLRDHTGRAGNALGHDVEVRVRWRINRHLEVDAGYDHWFKGGYFERLPPAAGLPPGGHRDTDYFYVLTNLTL